MAWPQIFVWYWWLGSTVGWRTLKKPERPSVEKGQSWVDLSDSVSPRSLDGCISPQSGSGKGKDDEECSLITTCHCWMLGSLCIVFFFFWHFCALILRSFRLYGTLTLKAWRLRPCASACMYTGVCMRCTQLKLCGLLKDFWPMVRLLCEASAADLYASWLEKNLQFFFFFCTSHMMLNCTCEKKMARREKTPAENRPVNWKVQASIDVHSVCLLW